MTTKPSILCLSGHDPSGGAGIQADIETLVSHQCHACSVVTALTEQDTRNVKKLLPQQPENLLSQARTILADIPIAAIKIGLLGHVDMARAIHRILLEYPDIPVVLDPVLAAGGGRQLADSELIFTIKDLLLPCTTLLTPNSEEARILAPGHDTLEQCAFELLAKDCAYVLITGSHEDTPTVTNRLYHTGRCLESYTWDRLPGSYHGSGCTLASSIAALLAYSLEPESAVLEAQQYTWNALQAGFKPGQGQQLPNRFFWMQENA